jgi:hypothetical protein
LYGVVLFCTSPPGVPNDISEAGPTSEEFLGYVNAAYERELDVLDRMIAEASMKKDALAKMKEETKGWEQQQHLCPSNLSQFNTEDCLPQVFGEMLAIIQSPSLRDPWS